ncbi:biotin-dependent enzyme [Jatrophihabitans sp. GAS493]|uniref:acetyl-CoA carboxylase family protein n=1 Tax=Jatrophihabitans sp. GAS493 TaxID=1907575 RepID=UPI000BBFCD59|nr:carboxyl transferase domain-containing protein [Jatrophihabitans sp. GAS493]SOD72106.1 biotin-dependent enzyme [Jatrophihabitans sp. GAS493]
MSGGPIRRLLIANRGEIAVRIIGTAAALGIETVAIYSTDDAASAHVARADAAVALNRVGPGAYLDVAAVVTAAKETGCDAVHPGYGFLAERAEFAAACAAERSRFVGPSPAALELFGDKVLARERANLLSVPVLPATSGELRLSDALAFRAGLGTDAEVMVKAIAGGGGRGMRRVSAADDLEQALREAEAEAQAGFGDGRLYLEQALTSARHIEVQVAGDERGQVSVLGDRDCSLQRRRQKLIEIAPAPALANELRRRLHESARALISSGEYAGLATVEFLVDGSAFYFLEVNPRIQVEHTVTEEVTGLDLVELSLRIAAGEGLDACALDLPSRQRGVSIQARVNAETMTVDGAVRPSVGILRAFRPPTGRGVRVDTHGYVGWEVGPRFDSLLAKVIVRDASPERAARLLIQALAEFEVVGVDTNLHLLRQLATNLDLLTGGADTRFVDTHLLSLLPDPIVTEVSVDDYGPAEAIAAPVAGVVVSVAATPGSSISAGTPLIVLEAMKMEHVVYAEHPGTVDEVSVTQGAVVDAGDVLMRVTVASTAGSEAADDPSPSEETATIRQDLAEVRRRHALTQDDARPEAIGRRHAAGRRTARENIRDLCDPGSFVEYGALAVAAQRHRRTLDELIRRTPADGLITGIAKVGGRSTVVMSYDYTVMAGTQGKQNHRKTERMLQIAAERRLPVVIFAEGGGGRPGDNDGDNTASLDSPSFRKAAELAGKVPMVAVVSGFCFAGNAALAGVCDVIIATEASSLGMGGPAMIEGAGLGRVDPADVGPMPVQYRNGVVDVLVADDPAAVAMARRYLSYFAASEADASFDDQRSLRSIVPERRVRVYDVRRVIHGLADAGSVMELRAGYGQSVITALVRLGGHTAAVIANNPMQLGGAIDADGADKAVRFWQLCESHRVPVLSLCDTPGFMVGPAAEQSAAVRRFGAMFATGARLTVPLCLVVLRKSYGLGAMAMAGGDFKKPLISLAWPTGEMGGMGLEGAVRLGFRAELDAIRDPAVREQRYQELVAEHYELGKALTVATAFSLDDVIDPAETRDLLISIFATGGAG